MKEPKYKIGDWVKLHSITAIGRAATYHIVAIRIEIFNTSEEVLYQLREFRAEAPVSLRTVMVAEMEIEAQVGSTKQ